MSEREKGMSLRGYVSVRLDSIRDECRKNQASSIIQTSYKPLLLESSERYRRNLTSQIFLSTERSNKSRNTNASTQFCMNMSTQLGTDRSRLSRNKPRLNTSKVTQSFTTNIWQLARSQSKKKEGFLSELYVAKTKDLKIKPNTKQQQMFTTRLSKTINQNEFLAPECDFGKQSATKICQYLTMYPSIQVLNLDRNPIGEEGIIQLANIIPIIRLKQLSLMSANMSSKSGCTLLNGATGHPTLQVLNLSSPDGFNRNRLGQDSMLVLKDLISHPQCLIKHLNLSNVNMGPNGFMSFCTGVKKAKKLRLQSINFSSNQIHIQADNWAYLRTCLEPLTTTKIEIQNNQLGDTGAQLFGTLLGVSYGRNPISAQVQYLDLSGNEIKSKGFDFLCSALCNNKKLSSLILNDNKLSDGDAFYQIRTFLTHNWSIKKLCLRNSVNASGDLKFVADGVSKNKSITYLDLSQNMFEIDSFLTLFQEIGSNVTLKTIKLENCNISDSFIAQIQPLLKRSCPLESINFNNNYITDKGARIMLAILAQNHEIRELSLRKNCINIHLLNEINYQLKDNKIIAENREEPPELSYFVYAERMQQNQRKNLTSAIKQLEDQQRLIQLKSHVESLVDKEKEIEQIMSQLEREKKAIEQLENHIRQKTEQAQTPEQ